jgi:beta-lactamase class A
MHHFAVMNRYFFMPSPKLLSADRTSKRRGLTLTLALAALLPACTAIPEARAGVGGSPQYTSPVPPPDAAPWQPPRPQSGPQPYPAQSYPSAPTYNGQAPQGLQDELGQLWRAFPGKTGIAVQRIDGGPWSVSFRGADYFPQQSVSKLWVGLTVLDQIDQGRLTLQTPVAVTYNDFTMFQSIVKDRVVANGAQNFTVGQLLEYSLTKSDNTANDKLLWLVGGPGVVRRTLAEKGISGIRFGPGERQMQSEIAGFSWRQDLGPGNQWFDARAMVSADKRRGALNAYVADPMDGAKPDAMVAALAMIARGEALSAYSTKYLLDTMGRTTSGPNRLKGGLPAGWSIGHKTGTGQGFGGTQTGYNDVGIITAPDGTRYAVAVMLAETTAPNVDRMAVMSNVTRAVVRWHY